MTDKFQLLESVHQQLFKEVERVYSSQGRLTDEVLSALQFVFQAPLIPALDLIDQKSVTLITSPSGRSIYQVIGSSGTPYTCFTTSLYCSCPAYRFSVLQKGSHVMCKHTLAIKLASVMGICRKLEVSNQEMVNIISMID